MVVLGGNFVMAPPRGASEGTGKRRDAPSPSPLSYRQQIQQQHRQQEKSMALSEYGTGSGKNPPDEDQAPRAKHSTASVSLTTVSVTTMGSERKNTVAACAAGLSAHQRSSSASSFAPSRTQLGIKRQFMDLMNDWEIGGTQNPWVCPSDRHLQLRAQLKSGWSVRTASSRSPTNATSLLPGVNGAPAGGASATVSSAVGGSTFTGGSALTDAEQEHICRVLARAERGRQNEELRIGKMVERLDKLRSRATGNGVTQCLLCQTEFGLLASKSYAAMCLNCRKYVCQRNCGVETFDQKRGEPIFLCKICSEYREVMWKKSGAWFYREMPNFQRPSSAMITTDGNYSDGAIPQVSFSSAAAAAGTCNDEIANSLRRRQHAGARHSNAQRASAGSCGLSPTHQNAMHFETRHENEPHHEDPRDLLPNAYFPFYNPQQRQRQRGFGASGSETFVGGLQRQISQNTAQQRLRRPRITPSWVHEKVQSSISVDSDCEDNDEDVEDEEDEEDRIVDENEEEENVDINSSSAHPMGYSRRVQSARNGGTTNTGMLAMTADQVQTADGIVRSAKNQNGTSPSSSSSSVTATTAAVTDASNFGHFGHLGTIGSSGSTISAAASASRFLPAFSVAHPPSSSRQQQPVDAATAAGGNYYGAMSAHSSGSVSSLIGATSAQKPASPSAQTRRIKSVAKTSFGVGATKKIASKLYMSNEDNNYDESDNDESRRSTPSTSPRLSIATPSSYGGDDTYASQTTLPHAGASGANAVANAASSIAVETKSIDSGVVQSDHSIPQVLGPLITSGSVLNSAVPLPLGVEQLAAQAANLNISSTNYYANKQRQQQHQQDQQGTKADAQFVHYVVPPPIPPRIGAALPLDRRRSNATGAGDTAAASAYDTRSDSRVSSRGSLQSASRNEGTRNMSPAHANFYLQSGTSSRPESASSDLVAVPATIVSPSRGSSAGAGIIRHAAANSIDAESDLAIASEKMNDPDTDSKCSKLVEKTYRVYEVYGASPTDYRVYINCSRRYYRMDSIDTNSVEKTEKMKVKKTLSWQHPLEDLNDEAETDEGRRHATVAGQRAARNTGFVIDASKVTRNKSANRTEKKKRIKEIDEPGSSFRDDGGGKDETVVQMEGFSPKKECPRASSTAFTAQQASNSPCKASTCQLKAVCSEPAPQRHEALSALLEKYQQSRVGSGNNSGVVSGSLPVIETGLDASLSAAQSHQNPAKSSEKARNLAAILVPQQPQLLCTPAIMSSAQRRSPSPQPSSSPFSPFSAVSPSLINWLPLPGVYSDEAGGVSEFDNSEQDYQLSRATRQRQRTLIRPALSVESDEGEIRYLDEDDDFLSTSTLGTPRLLISSASQQSLRPIGDRIDASEDDEDHELEADGYASAVFAEHIDLTTSNNTNDMLGSIQFNVTYLPEEQQLIVHLIRAKNLKAMDKNGFSDPYVKLHLIPGNVKATKLTSKTIEKTLNPEWHEEMVYYGVTEDDRQRKFLRVTVLDRDRIGSDFLGETRVALKKLPAGVVKKFHLYLEHAMPTPIEKSEELERGKILVAICYNIQQGSLFINIKRCSELLGMDSTGFSDPYCKVTLSPLTSKAHRQRTSTKKRTLNPEFNAQLQFIVPFKDLPKKTLNIAVYDYDVGRHDDYIGGILLSTTAKDLRGKQWRDCIQNPGKTFEYWHKLELDN